jgi:hypothetical protein
MVSVVASGSSVNSLSQLRHCAIAAITARMVLIFMRETSVD